MTEKTQNPHASDLDWNSASWETYRQRVERLHDENRAGTVFFSATGYTLSNELKTKLRKAGFESELNSVLEGVSVHLEDEETFKKLQEYASEKGLKIKVQVPFT